jgi:hypothetical protein
MTIFVVARHVGVVVFGLALHDGMRKESSYGKRVHYCLAGIWMGVGRQLLTRQLPPICHLPKGIEKPPLGMIRKWRFLREFLVGVIGFEPTTPASRRQNS